MSNRNKNRRKAEQRQRHRSSFADGSSTDGGRAGASGVSVEAASEAMDTAARYHAGHNSTAAAAIVDALVAVQGGADERVVDTAVTLVLSAQLARLWEGGWLPVDVYEMARRQHSDLAASLAVDAIADNAAQHASAVVHPRWQAQLDQLDAQRWWDHSRPHASQWTERHRLARRDTLRTVIELLGLFKTMAPLPVIVPPPGHVPAQQPRTPSGPVDEKMLSKVRALLAKAESTSFSEEAEALSAKAQELMARYSIERAMTEPPDQTPVASACRIWLNPPYVGAKSLLVAEVASANRCRTVSYEKLGFVTVLGDDVDLDVVEVLSTSLMVQATRAMLAAGRQITYSGQSRTRSFRHSFLIAYATRIGERLRDVTEESVAAAGNDLVPVFARREQAVDELFDALFARRVSRRSFSVGSSAGYGAGRAAADQAVLNADRRAVTKN